MSELKYEVVEHDGGWAYKVGGVFSETFPDHDTALGAARDAAERQGLAGETEGIAFQDEKGRWHEEVARGDDRPMTEIVDGSEPH
ncbi:DUF2188 domain-containing protein [Aureimonas populi]|uniref:DUF2188 domain-containing protein n=1 Tax=Aureimonas populi TaxID=1701758 RepID=A0ABW5CGU1_9HYPH|nr:DUF2188 domain-containing protein [Aureimonas populi]